MLLPDLVLTLMEESVEVDLPLLRGGGERLLRLPPSRGGGILSLSRYGKGERARRGGERRGGERGMGEAARRKIGELDR